MFKPAPKMPENLPALPMGKNGKPLVYLGTGLTFNKNTQLEGYSSNETCGCWNYCTNLEGNYQDLHYAAESDSEVCKLNGWGDFAPVEAKPVEKKTAMQIYQEAARAALDEAEKECERLASALREWGIYKREMLEIVGRLDAKPECSAIGSAIARKSWYDAGRKDERHHAKVRTVFPVHP